MVTYRSGIIQERIRAVRRTITAAGGKALDKTAGDAQEKLMAVVATWANQPAFEVTARDTGQVLARDVSIYGTVKAVRVWGYVDKGTKPHKIAPKRAGGSLVFRAGYTAKTAFRAQFGGAGKATGTLHFRKVVHHPGSKGRDFSGQYREEAAAELRDNVIKELQR